MRCESLGALVIRRLQTLLAAGLVAVAVDGALSSVRAATTSGLWASLPAPPTSYEHHTATLMPDGKILVAGGFVPATFPEGQVIGPTFSGDAALYRPATDDWLPLPSMATPRGYHAAAFAGNGKVVVAGGIVRSGTGKDIIIEPVPIGGGDCGAGGFTNPTTDVELFDPATLGWSSGPPMSKARAGFSLVRLADGRILAAGGGDSTQAEVYDATTNAWSSAGAMNSSRMGAAYALMPDGRVMVTGGNYGALWPFCDSTAEIYDPAGNTWTATDAMSLDRRWATATVITLSDGSRRVLVAGGYDNRSSPLDFKATAELYDPATNKWTLTGSMATARARHTATRLKDGRVLVTGGMNADGDVASAELYDPATGAWTTLSSMASPRSSHTATALLGFNSKVVVVGGMGASNSAELFQPTPIGSATDLNASGACQPITLMADVRSGTGQGIPTGTVTFYEGSTPIGSDSVLPYGGNGRAVLTLGPLAVGPHSFSASYSGDDAFDLSSGTLAQDADPPLSVAISGKFPSQALGTSVTLPASVTGGSPPYSYVWILDKSVIAGGSTLTDTPPLGVNVYKVAVTDAHGCTSESAPQQIDVFDFSINVAPTDLTLLRAGDPQGIGASITLAPGSSTNGLPGIVTVRAAGGPPGLIGSGGPQPAWNLGLPQTPGATLVSQVSLQAMPTTSLGDFAVSIDGSAGGGTRSAPLNVHLFDYTLSMSPDATGYRSGYPVSFEVTSTVVPGSTQALPGALLATSVTGVPPDATFSLPNVPISGSTLLPTLLMVSPGSISTGDYPLQVTATANTFGSRSANGVLHLLVDTTPPAIGLTVTGTPGANGWYVSDVTVAWTVSDPETPVTSTNGCATSFVNYDTPGVLFTCAADSGGGAIGRAVTIRRDVTPPVLTLPAPLTVNANQPAGAVVAYTATAADNVDPAPALSCQPASGTLFPVGQTTVGCAAVNAAGLQASGSFAVNVLGPSQQVNNLINTVNSLPATPGNSLAAKLQQILASIASGDTANACNQLNAFINEVKAQSGPGKSISAGDAASLIQQAQTVQQALGC